MEILLECKDCGWRGEQIECDKNYEPAYDGDVEPKLSCPKCGSDELYELDGHGLQLSPC